MKPTHLLSVIAFACLSSCGEPTGPLPPLDDLLGVRVLEDTVPVALLVMGSSMEFTPRLEIHNRSRRLPLRWGGCAWLELQTAEGVRAKRDICAAMLSADDRPVIQPGELVILEPRFQICRSVSCGQWELGDAIDGDYRFRAIFGAYRPRFLEERAGRQAGTTLSNVFSLHVTQ